MQNDCFDPKMLEVLVCPHTQGRLSLSQDRNELISHKAKVAYPIRFGVPIMLLREARELTESERAKAKATRK